MQTIEPASKVLFCRPKDKETKTNSGFILPEAAAMAPQIAEVINTGDGVTYKPHDEIVYKSYTTSDITLDGTEYFLINEEDVLGKVIAV